ncbi:helix-hairpin-helix domain-containing protein [Streptomyces hirsutus]|uniref:helix-hairpin-helix domain-containing protein n=1 Tax=Streptomyces hirsutus TaxID=35620 RepID=UPI00363DFA69
MKQFLVRLTARSGREAGGAVEFRGSGVSFARAVEKKLLRAQVTSVEQLLALNERELRSLPDIGPVTVSSVIATLAEAGLSLAADPYEAYECARHSDVARDAELRSYFLCNSCRDAYAQLAFGARSPEWVSSERVEGYCGHCNELRVVRLSQWFLCGTCDRVVRSLGRGLASAKFVESVWADTFRGTSELSLRETDPVELRPRGRRSDVDRVSTADFVADDASGKAVLGIELKSGRSALAGDGIGNTMPQFQLDTTDCDDITAAAITLNVPVFLVHAQVIGRAHAPTERYEGVGLWFARPWDMLQHLEAVRRRPRETRDAAYFKTAMFRPFAEFPAYMKDQFWADFESMRRDGFPLLYQR